MSQTDARRCLIAAGGTGGHMFPARSAAMTLIERGWQVQLVTDHRGAKHAHDFPGEPIKIIEASSPFSKNPLILVKSIFKLLRGLRQAKSLISQFQPDIIAGFGGYPAFPALAAARFSQTPYIIHEQNAVLGRVNRVFASGACYVASGFDRLDKLKVKARHVVTGNPIRQSIRAIGYANYQAPQGDDPITILVLGGSLGARILSDIVPKAIANLPEELKARLHIIQQTRPEALDLVNDIYAAAGVRAELSPFFEDMASLYAKAHLVISRAGASSVSEIAGCGLPALFVPLGIAMDDHQTANAESLVKAGAAISLSEGEFIIDAVRDELAALLLTPGKLGQLAKAAMAVGRINAHEDLADLICNAVE